MRSRRRSNASHSRSPCSGGMHRVHTSPRPCPRPAGYRENVQLRVAGHGGKLRLAGTLHPVHVVERLRHSRPDGEQPVIAQDHAVVLAEMLRQHAALRRIALRSVEVVVGDAAVEPRCGLGQRQQPALQRGDRHAGDGVGVHCGHGVRPRPVDRAVDHEACRMQAVSGVGLVQHLAVEIDLEEAGGRHLVEQHAVRVDEEVVRRVGNAG